MPSFEAAFRLLSQSLFGIIVVDGEGRAVSMNESAQEILSAKDGLTLQDGIVTPARSFERARLTTLFENLADAAEGWSHRLLVGRPSGRLPYAVLVAPFKGEEQRTAALLLVTDFDMRTTLNSGALTEFFGFTAAEARLAVAIAQGKDLRQIAHETGRALPTLRAQLRALFQKTGVTRQSELVRLVLGIPAIRL